MAYNYGFGSRNYGNLGYGQSFGGYGNLGYGSMGSGGGFGRRFNQGFQNRGLRNRGFGRRFGGYGNLGYGSMGPSRFGRSFGGYGNLGYGQSSSFGNIGYGNLGYGLGSQGLFSSPTTWTYTEYWLIPGPFSGVGPQNYQRSDQRIKEDVNDRLTAHGQINPSKITVDVSSGIVTLKGDVDSRREKRTAEDIANSVPGVQDVHNELKVQQKQGQQSMMGQSSMQGQSSSQQSTSQQTSSSTTGSKSSSR